MALPTPRWACLLRCSPDAPSLYMEGAAAQTATSFKVYIIHGIPTTCRILFGVYSRIPVLSSGAAPALSGAFCSPYPVYHCSSIMVFPILNHCASRNKPHNQSSAYSPCHQSGGLSIHSPQEGISLQMKGVLMFPTDRICFQVPNPFTVIVFF